jgi:membrane associated rhomboid family serine protease
MSRYVSPGDHEHEPITWLNGRPIYAAHLIVVVYVISLLVTTVMMWLNASALLQWLAFDNQAVLEGEVWRIATYGFYNPPSIPFVIDMFMLVWFGREVERFFGRGKFLSFYAAIYLITPLVFTALGRWLPFYRIGETGAFAMFIAFATLYPGAPVLFDILAKWLAIVLVGVFTLIALANHDMAGLIALWLTCGLAFGYVRYQQGHFSLPRLRWPRRKPKLRVLPDLPPKPSETNRLSTAKMASMAEVDALLDKIAQSGISSLTPKERAKLDQARAALMKRK